MTGAFSESAALLETWKQTPERVVALMRDDRGTRFVRKIHRGRRGAARARREARALRALEAAAVPAPRVLGLHCGLGEGALDLEWLEGSQSLESLFPPFACDRAAAARGLALLAPALALLRRAAAAGVWDPDLHAGNVLVDPRGGLALIDLHRARLLPAPLARAVLHRVERRFLRFFLAFAAPAALARVLGCAAEEGERIVRRAQRSRRVLLRGKDRRAKGHHRAFELREGDGGRWLCERGFDAQVLERALACASGSSAPDLVLKDRAAARVVALDEHWVAKIFGESGARARRRARAAFQASLAFVHSRVRTARARALWIGATGAILICERGPAQNAARWLYGAAPGARAQCRVARDLARTIAVLHRDGLRPRDLRAENFLVDERLRVHCIDLEGVARRLRRPPALARSARDAARLRASFPPPAPLHPRAIELFARVYAAERGLSEVDLRRWREVAATRADELWQLWRRRGLRFDEHGIHDSC